MAYAAWSVVFGETPSASKWNILGTNDSSFNDGSGIGASAILNAALANGAVTGVKMDWSALGILNTPNTANFSGTGVSRLSQAYTVPAGCTKLLVLGSIRMQSQTAATTDMSAWVREGASNDTPVGTMTAVGTFNGSSVAVVGVLTVTAGSKTMQLMATSANSANMSVASVLLIPLFA